MVPQRLNTTRGIIRRLPPLHHCVAGETARPIVSEPGTSRLRGGGEFIGHGFDVTGRLSMGVRLEHQFVAWTTPLAAMSLCGFMGLDNA